jgi:glycopeptide antibiotics resistance protein
MYGLGQWLLDSALAAVLMLGLIAIGGLLLVARRGRARWRSAAADGFLVFAIGLVALFTLLPARFGEQPDRVNLLPFRDLLWAMQGRVDLGIAIAGLLGNLALFLPLGLALAMRSPSRHRLQLIGAGLAVSLAVEAGQALLDIGRLADVTDLLLNTLGAAVGIWLWRSFQMRRIDRQYSRR